MVEGGVTIGIGAHCGSSSSSHSSSSSTSSSSKGKDTRLLIRVSSSIPTERIHSFFDRSLAAAKPPIGAGFVKKVHRKSDDTVVISIEDSSIARRIFSYFSDSRSKIDGHEFTIELYKSDHSKSLSSPSNHNGDKKREKESRRMSSCTSLPSPSSSIKRQGSSSYSSPSTSQPSTSTHESNRKECCPSTSSPVNPYNGIVGVSIHSLPEMSDNILREVLRAGLREIGGYLTHFNEGGTKVLLKRSPYAEEMEAQGTLNVQGEETTFITMSIEETHRLYDRYSSNAKSRCSLPSTSSSSPSIPLISRICDRERDAMSYNSSRTIFIPCLPKGVSKDYIRKRFHKIGTVLESDLKNVHSISPHAIVQFSHTQGAVVAMDDYEREQREEGINNPIRNKKFPHFVRSLPSTRIWVANLPPHDEDYVKKKLLELLKGAQNPTIVVDLRRREGIIDFSSIEKAKHYLEIFKSSPLIQQGGSVHTWLVSDYCSQSLYDNFIERRGITPSPYEGEYISTVAKITLTDKQKSEAEARMERIKGGDEKTAEKKKSMNGENGHHSHSPSTSRRLNGEDRRSGDSGFSEDRDKAGTNHPLESDDDEVLDKKWSTAPVQNNQSEENGLMGRRLLGLDEHIASFIHVIPKTEKVIKKEIKEEEDGEKKENEKITCEGKKANFQSSLLTVSSPFKAKPVEEIGGYRRSDPLKSPPIPISPLNGDKERRHLMNSPPIGHRPSPLHINIPPSTSNTNSNTVHSPYTRLPPSTSTSSSRHPSISTPSTLTPRSHTLPSNNRQPFHNEYNGDNQWNGGGASNVGTPTSSRLPLSRRESVCSNSSQSYTPLPPSQPSTSGIYTPNALKSPPVASWNSSVNTWSKGGPSLPSPLPSSINRSRQSIDSHHKSSAPSLSRPLGLPKHSMDKSGFGLGPSSSLPKTPSLPRSTSMSEKRPPNISRDSSKDIVNSILQNERDVKKMPRIPKKENRERDEKEERREKKREEKDRERREDREERKEKKEDRKKSRENETKDQKAERKEKKGKKKKEKEKEKEERKKSTNDKEKKRKSIDGGEKKKKKKQKRTSSDSESDSDSDDFKPSSSNQMKSDEALARLMSGGSMYDRVKGRRSGPNKEEKRKNDALEAIRKKKGKKSTKRVHLSSSSSSDDDNDKESRKKYKKEEDEESSDEDEKDIIKKEKKERKKKREKERKESSDESDSDDEKEKERIEEEKKKKKEKKVSKKPSTTDLFSETDSEKSVKKDKLSKKRSHDKEELDCPSTSSTHPPPGKKAKKEESSSCGSESEDEIEISSKKSEVSTSSWRGREGKRLSESSIATHSEKDFGRNEEEWKSPISENVEKEIKEEPKEEPHPPRLLTKAAMKEFNTASSSPLAGPSWSREEKGGIEKETSDSSVSSSESEEEKEEHIEERKENEDVGEEREEREERIEERIENVEINDEMDVKMEEDPVEEKDEEEIKEKKEEDEIKEEIKIEEEDEKMDEEEIKSIEKDEEAESAVRGLQLPSDDVIEETEKAVESIFDEDEEPEVHYPSADFLNQVNSHDLNLSSSSSQSSSPKQHPSSSNHPLLSSSSLVHRPTPLHPSSISSPSILSPSHHHLIQSHTIPSIHSSSPLISPHFIQSPSSSSRPSSIHNFNVRPISQESSSQNIHDENGILIQQEKSWTPQGSSSDGPSPSPNQHPINNTQEIVKNFPVKWHGKVEVKKNEMNTSWYKVHGDEHLLNTVFPALNSAIKVTGKFRLDNQSIQEFTNMERGQGEACLVVTPSGKSADEVIKNRDLFSEHLVDFFLNKNIAGVIEFRTNEGPVYRCHMFAPGEFMTQYLSPHYPDFLDLLNRKYPKQCLLALLKKKEDL